MNLLSPWTDHYMTGFQESSNCSVVFSPSYKPDNWEFHTIYTEPHSPIWKFLPGICEHNNLRLWIPSRNHTIITRSSNNAYFCLRTFEQGCLNPPWGDIHLSWLISQFLALNDLALGSLLLTFFSLCGLFTHSQTIPNYDMKEILAE